MEKFINKRNIKLGLAFLIFVLLSLYLLFSCDGAVSVYFGIGAGIVAAVFLEKMIQGNRIQV